MGRRATVSRTAEVAAPPARVWELVTDLPGTGERSLENTGGHWLDAGGPALGARFAGTNRHGRRTWSTVATVVEHEPERRFAFEVAAGGLAVARWTYALEPSGGGTRVTESWTDLRGPVVALVGRVASGVRDREAFTARSIEHTLARLQEQVAPTA